MAQSVAHVLPLRKLPRGKGLFDYSLPTKLAVSPGDLVEVSFRGTAMPAIVFKVDHKLTTKAALKPINQLLVPALLNSIQLRLVAWLADYYGTSLATVIRLAASLPAAGKTLATKATWTRAQTTSKTKPINIVVSSQKESRQVISSLVKRVVNRGQQVLLLVPEIHLVAKWQKEFKNHYPLVVYTSSGRKIDLRQAWLEVRQNQTKLIIGTKPALWLNFARLGGIIMTQAENENYRQTDQNPRYDALTLAERLAALSGAPLAKISVAPNVVNWFRARLGQELWQPSSQEVGKSELIDLRAKPWGQSELISPALAQAIAKTLRLKKKILLYLNRRGTATTSVCADCGLVAVCASCQRRLVWSDQDDSLHCYHCVSQQPPAIPCPSCGSVRVLYQGAGLGRLAKEVQLKWPGINSVTIEGELKPEHFKQAQAAQLILGSRTALRAVTDEPLGLAAIILAETDLAVPEFRAAETFWQRLRNLLAQSEVVICQTYQPHHYLWAGLSNKKITSFYQAELNLRRQFSYPPAVRLLRLTYQAQNEAASRQAAQNLRLKIKALVPDKVQVIGPYPDYYRLRRRQWRWHLLLKYDNNFEPRDLWPHLPSEVIIDRDPNQILS